MLSPVAAEHDVLVRKTRELAVALVVLCAWLVGCSSSTPDPSTSSSVEISLPSASSTGTASTSVPSSPVSSSAPASASVTQPGSAGTTAGKEAVCAARDQLQASVADLTSTSLLGEGTTAVKAAVDKVQADLDALAAAGREDYRPQLDAMQSALQELQTTVSSIGDGNTSDNLAALGSSIAPTAAAAQQLFAQLQASCGS